ncbi:MAG: translational GTPase TypA [Candidatus Pacebacteria bacterium]|nr:translational GTPase TypA [Candidatus Paceibacterota bacterium]
MNIKNIAIIAHVDHGKTTLIDGLLKQTHSFRDNQSEMTQDRIMDSNDQESERGITILAKTTAITYKDTKINIIDTPGHADFGGEVERVINMADGAILLVDAAEGPLPQTRFVLEMALERKLKVILVINKIDRGDAIPGRVLADTEELFLNLVDDESQLDFPVIFAVARDGKAWDQLPDDFNEKGSLIPLLDEILKTIPSPEVDATKPFKMLVSNIDFDSYKGVHAVGKIMQGTVKPGDQLSIVEEDTFIKNCKVQYVLASNGLDRVEVEEGMPGDIVAITGVEGVEIGQTLTDPSDPHGYPKIKITDPTLSIQIGPNSSPFKGKEGEFCTARQLEDRLQKEKKINLGLRIESNPNGTGYLVSGRGELHLSVLIENMRREGYEMEVGKPQVILKEIDGVKSEPMEELTVEIDKDFVGIITEEMGKRRAELLDSVTNAKGTARMVYKVSSRNLLGFRSEIMTKTRGNGIFASRFLGYFPVVAVIPKLRNGVLIATEQGTATGYSIESIQKRGATFVGPGVAVYNGMIIGQNTRQEDMEMNICKGKQLTNVRAASADQMLKIAPPVELSLEQSLDFIEDDELLEVTPQNLRLRKKILDKNLRHKAKKNS